MPTVEAPEAWIFGYPPRFDQTPMELLEAHLHSTRVAARELTYRKQNAMAIAFCVLRHTLRAARSRPFGFFSSGSSMASRRPTLHTPASRLPLIRFGGQPCFRIAPDAALARCKPLPACTGRRTRPL